MGKTRALLCSFISQLHLLAEETTWVTAKEAKEGQIKQKWCREKMFKMISAIIISKDIEKV